ncbi:MAG TPA: PAS domain S-box protein [Gemmataceae bacterium]|nr:PAS domain S-box protein [Gemmataceae bacterium]
MPISLQSPVVRYPIAVAAVALAVVVRLLLDPVLDDGFPFATLFFAVLAVAWYGGFGPAVVATLVGLPLAARFLLPPRDGFAVTGFDNRAGLLLYLLVGTGIAVLGGVMHRGRERALAAATAARGADAARRYLAAIVEGSEDAIVGKDLDGTITSWNAAAERLYGYPAAEVVGKPFTVLVPQDRAAEMEAMAGRLRRGARVDHFETVRRRKDGTLVPVSVSYSPIRDPDGRLIGTAAITRDVTDQRHAVAALKASEARFAALIHNAPAIVFLKDSAGLYLMVNRRCAENVGLTIEQNLGKTDHELFPPAMADAFRRDDEDVLRTGRVRTYEESFEVRGRRYTYLTSKFPLPGDSGRPIGVCGIATDITDHERDAITSRILADASAVLAALTDEESTLQKLATLAVPHFADWCVVDMASPDGPIRRVAWAHVDPEKVKLAREISERWPPDPAAPHGVPEILRTGRSQLVPQITDEILIESIRDPELLAVVRDLGLRSYIGVPLTVRGKPIGAITFVAAESGRTYDAKDLAAAEDLARRAAVAIENAQLYQAVREADRRKEEFLATLAHELRNPLAPIRNSLYLLNATGGGNPTLERALGMMGRQTDHLTRLVDDLLDVSRVMRGKIDLRPERVDVRAVASRAVETAQPLMDARRHRLTVTIPEQPVWIRGDPDRLAQVVGNLLTNAARYTDPGGEIRLSVEKTDGRSVLRVRDTGIGIGADMLPKVFDLFFQADTSAGGTQGGLGIGLTLVKRLVELHGGTIEVRSPGPGQGTEFVVRLPVLAAGDWPSPTADVGTGVGNRQPPASTPRRVLVVDDHADAADSLAWLLRMDGHDVRVARNGPAAVESAQADPPDVVLLDLGMPGMDGFEVARRLRQGPAARTVIAALTGWGQEEDRRRTREAGFDHHLVKPADPNDLRELLAHVRAE